MHWILATPDFQICQETVQNDNLALLKHTIQSGWPQKIQGLPPKIHKHWTFHVELTIEDGIVVKGTCLIIPETQRKDILQQIHRGHLGIQKCQLQARETVYCPAIYRDFEEMVKNCKTCLKFSANNGKQTPDGMFGYMSLL